MPDERSKKRDPVGPFFYGAAWGPSCYIAQMLRALTVLSLFLAGISFPAHASRCVIGIENHADSLKFEFRRRELISRLDAVASPTSVQLAVEALARAFAQHSDRIADPWIAENAFGATLDHAETVEDLENAVRALKQGRGAAEFYFTRMVFFSKSLAQAHRSSVLAVPRLVASRELRDFDRKVRERGVLWHPQLREVVHVPLQEGAVAALQSEGISICEQPVHGLRFNDGLFFNPGELYSWEKKAAQALSQAKPRERFLGLGDKGVRRFHSYYSIEDGTMKFQMPTADYLTIEEEVSGRYVLHIRELKFKEPTSRVDVAEALAQLRSSAKQISARFGQFPIRNIELILPQRGVWLGDGYSRLATPIDDAEPVYELLDPQSETVRVDLPQGSVPIRIRLMDFPER